MNNNEKLLSTLVTPFQSLETALQQLLTERSIDTAVGAQLDVIGRIVGQPRNSLDDDTYRRHCRARIATSRSNGTIEDLLKVADLVLYDDDAVYQTDNQGIATVVLRVLGIPVTAELADTLTTFLGQTVSAGVRVITESSQAPVANWLRLDEGNLDEKNFLDARSN